MIPPGDLDLIPRSMWYCALVHAQRKRYITVNAIAVSQRNQQPELAVNVIPPDASSQLGEAIGILGPIRDVKSTFWMPVAQPK